MKKTCIAVLVMLLATPLFAQKYGGTYTADTPAGLQTVTIEARNGDFVFELAGATAYASFFQTEDCFVYYLTADGWLPADNEHFEEFVLNAERSCEPYEMTTEYGRPADGPAGDLVWVSDFYAKDESLTWLDYAYIPLSSELSFPGYMETPGGETIDTSLLMNADGGTFYTSCLLEDGQCITCCARIDCYLYNNEMYLLEPDMSSWENQLTIMNRMLLLQMGVYTEDDVPLELVEFAQAPVLPQFIAESVWNNTISSSEGYPLYESFDPENGYIALYLHLMRQYQLPILYSDVIIWFGFDYEGRNLQMIDAETGNAIAAKGLELADSGLTMNKLLSQAMKSQGLGMETLVIEPEPDTVHLFDLEAFGVLVPFINDIVPGNVLVNTRNEDNPFALVIRVNDDAETRDDITVLHYDEAAGCIKQCTWAELDRPEHYAVRHLLDLRTEN